MPGRMIGDGVDIEEHRAGDVLREIFRMRIATRMRPMPRRVEDHDIWIGEPLGVTKRGVFDCRVGMFAFWPKITSGDCRQKKFVPGPPGANAERSFRNRLCNGAEF